MSMTFLVQYWDFFFKNDNGEDDDDDHNYNSKEDRKEDQDSHNKDPQIVLIRNNKSNIFQIKVEHKL